MNDPFDALGGRIKLLRPSDLTAAQKQAYDLVNTTMVPWAEAAGFQSKTDDGRLIGPFNSILHSPAISSASSLCKPPSRSTRRSTSECARS